MVKNMGNLQSIDDSKTKKKKKNRKNWAYVTKIN